MVSFVEFGAMDGLALSNTWHLEHALGWNGILAEPYPAWHASLRTHRRARIDPRCVWSESGKEINFVATHQHPEFSTVAEFADGDMHAATRKEGAETIVVTTVSLNDLLAEHRAPEVIDYLSIDTEGSELDILSAFDFGRYKVRIITVEHNYRADIRAAMQQLLHANGFVREFEAFSWFDDWYFHPGRV
jgi:FkbM family methyltransferase